MSAGDSRTTSSSELSRFSEALLPSLLLEWSRRNPDDPLAWTEANRQFSGRPMRIPPALQAIYRERHPYVVVVKPSQVGATEMNINLALWAAATNQGGRGSVLYLMPTQELADRMSQRRFAAAFAQSPSLRKLIAAGGDGGRPAQRIQMRSVGPGVIYLSGADQVSQYTGVDADLVVLDEYDQMKAEVLANAYARLRSSQLGWLRVTSTPTTPEVGVHGLLMLSDERHYEMHCPSCEAWFEPRFPVNVDFDAGTVVCGCGTAVDPWGAGRWVPSRPDVTDVRGYHLNRLCLPSPPIEQMRLAASGTIGLGASEFWRQDLGIPYVSEEARLTADQLDRCRTEEPPPLARLQPDCVVMGVDVGHAHFWVVVRLFARKRSYPLFVEKVVGDWDELLNLIDRFKVAFVAVDGEPDTRGAKRFVEAAIRRRRCQGAFRVFYRQGGTEHDWDWGDQKITAVRTLSLDEMFDGFRRQESLLPIEARELAGGAYYEHMQALVRITEPDNFGQPLSSYRHTRPDDFAHAENYITLVASRLGGWGGWWG